MDYNEQMMLLGDFVKGTCEFMCPVNERLMREREKLLHPLELQEPCDEQTLSAVGRHPRKKAHCIADPSKTVKAFTRSAAGLKMPSSSDLRPFPILDETVSYLIEKIACCDIDLPSWVERYDFVVDRLRAVRQDMVIQGLPPHESIKLLEPMVKFHVFGGYWLCESSFNRFDPAINASLLQECMKRLLVLYDFSKQIKREGGSSDHVLGKLRSHHSQGNKCCSTEHLMESLYLIINVGDSHALNRALLRLQNVVCDCQLTMERAALKTSLCAWRGDYVAFCRCLKNLNPLLCMAAALHLPSIRRHALMVMDTAYSSKSSKFPIQNLIEILLWDNQEQALAECKHYGLCVQDSSLCFQRGSFDQLVKKAQPLRLRWLDEMLSRSKVVEILC